MPMIVASDQRFVRGMILAWAVVWVLTAALIAALQYESPDPDSVLYAGISARVSERPVAQWIAPEWWGLWGMEGPYTDHPVGLFIAPATLARLGYPAGQAAYAVNAFWQMAAFLLITLIAVTLVPPREALAAAWLVQLMPITYVFRIRANHEYAVLACAFFAIYATEQARTRPRWVLGMLGGFCAVLFVKGAFAFIVPVTCALWLVARRLRLDVARDWQAWVAIASMPVIAGFAIWGYEAAYTQVTGRSFLDGYTGRHLPPGDVLVDSLPTRTAYSAVWYLGRVVWYAFPWSLLAGLALVAAVRQRNAWPWAGRVRNQADRATSTTRQAAWFAFLTTVALIAAYSLAHRKADRYIFPVYFVVGAAGVAAGIRRFPGLARVVDRLDRPWMPAAIYVLMFFVNLFLLFLVTTGWLREFTFWRT